MFTIQYSRRLMSCRRAIEDGNLEKKAACNDKMKLNKNQDYFFVLQQTEYLNAKLNQINFDLLTAAHKPSVLLKPAGYKLPP